MASQSRRPNGSNGTHHGARLTDFEAIRSRAELVTVSAAGIARIADEVAQGATSQLGSLDAALEEMNEVVTSLVDTAGQAESESWEAFLAYYATLSGMAMRIPELANALEPVTTFMASPRKRRDVPAAPEGDAPKPA